jgi:hypothetical protein
MQRVDDAMRDSATTVLHVMDREGDDYGLLVDAMAQGRRFVIRMCHDRYPVSDPHTGSNRGALAHRLAL